MGNRFRMVAYIIYVHWSDGGEGKPIVNCTQQTHKHTRGRNQLSHTSPFHKHSESEMLRAARRGSLFLLTS